MIGRAHFVVWAALGFGCSLLDQPPPASPESAKAEKHPPSRHEALAGACQCATGQAELELRDALAVLESGPRGVEQRSGFSGCVNAMTGVPTPRAARVESSDDRAGGLIEVSAELAKRRVFWQFSIEDAGWDAGSGGRPLDALRSRLVPLAGAVRDAYLASQLCHATALFVALEPHVTHEHAEPDVLSRSVDSARRSDSIAATGTAFALELRALGQAKAPATRLRAALERARRLSFDGVFASDVDDVERLAARQARALGDRLKPLTGDDLGGSSDLPLWLVPRPSLSSLCEKPRLERAYAADLGLRGLRAADLRKMIIAANVLYPEDSPPRHGLAAACALLSGDDAGALASAREIVPGYSETAALLAAIQAKGG